MNTAKNFFYENNERPLPMQERSGCFDNPPCLHRPIDGDGDGEKSLINGCAWRLKGRINDTVAQGMEADNGEVEILVESYACNTRGFVGKIVQHNDHIMLYNPTDKTTRPLSKAGIERGLNRNI